MPAAFTDVTDTALLADFKKTNDAVIAALGSVQDVPADRTCCRRSKGSFAFGADTYAKALAANEMVDLPLDRLLEIAEADRQKNEDAFQATAKQIDPKKTPEEVLARAAGGSPGAGRSCCRTTQDTLDSLRQFIVDPPHHHDSAVRSGAREGDAAVHALDDVGVDGHARAVRDRRSSTASTT